MPTYIKSRILIYNINFLSLKYIILLIIFILRILIFFSSFFSKSFPDIEKYYSFNKNEILLKKKHFNKVETPKISIISAIYNKEKYLLRFIRNIQNQDFDDIEIILVDDCSNDNTIKYYREYAKRR